jgi:CubicO group peptidase (beta-lactamase class C family)
MQATLANWRTAPHNRWAFHHVRELVPSADIAHDPGAVRVLEGKHSPGLVAEDFLERTDTDGMAVLHRGRLVLERYRNGMGAADPHILMSVSKSMLGVLAAEMRLDAARRVSELVPELRDTAYGGATIRDLLDMRAGISFNEDYLATSGPIIEYRKATGWNPLAPGESPSDLKSFLLSLKERDGEHGGAFHYCSPNTDLLGWVIERAGSARYADLMSELVWRKVGAERSAYITLDRLGAPRCAGGLCVTLRDLARVGLWLIEERGDWLAALAREGDAGAWARGDLRQYYPGEPMRYRSQWYVLDGPAPLAFGMGIHGQNLFVDAANEIVIAKLSSQALPLDAQRIALTMREVAGLRQRLA